MKSHIRFDYIQLPYKVFVKQFPEFAELLPPVFDINDERYIVRMSENSIEVGYAEDDWFLEGGAVNE